MPASCSRVILVDNDDEKGRVLAERLRSQGYEIDVFASGTEAASQALAAPPAAIVADLWMPGVSGVQLCRLLRAEPATEHVPVVLRGPADTSCQRFWAERAGAAAYVARGRMGELVRSLASAIAAAPASDGFFQLHPRTTDIRDRICHELDAALYRSVVASEVRALCTCETFSRLFDQLSQLLCQITSYRWLAVASDEVNVLGVHVRPEARDRAIAEAREALEADAAIPVLAIEDEDADPSLGGPTPVVRELRFGRRCVGRIALAPAGEMAELPMLMQLLGNELGGPLRIVSLVERARRLASTDPLTGLLNRRSFRERVAAEISRSERLGNDLSLLLLDIDHFKAINDTHGHNVGDLVLEDVGRLVKTTIRAYDHAARWGGEEFVVVLPQTPFAGALAAAERIRAAIEQLQIQPSIGEPIGVTVSIGVVARRSRERLDGLIDRADRAMYAAKSEGRNRVVAGEPTITARAI